MVTVRNGAAALSWLGWEPELETVARGPTHHLAVLRDRRGRGVWEVYRKKKKKRKKARNRVRKSGPELVPRAGPMFGCVASLLLRAASCSGPRTYLSVEPLGPRCRISQQPDGMRGGLSVHKNCGNQE